MVKIGSGFHADSQDYRGIPTPILPDPILVDPTGSSLTEEKKMKIRMDGWKAYYPE